MSGLEFPSKCASIYLNRVCPRKCKYCSVFDKAKDDKKLSVEEWKMAMDILETRGVEFFLILGSEPLVLGDDLVELVKYWSKKDYEYGLYTTSPKFWFDKYKDKLVDAGLRNWSSGIDFIPEVYSQMKNRGMLTPECIKLVDKEEGGLVTKATDGLNGMDWMYSKRIEEQHVLITVSRMNIEFAPEMVKYLVDRFGSTLRVALNYVECGGGDFDFAPERKHCREYLIRERDLKIYKYFVNKMEILPERYKLRVQIPFEYLSEQDYILNLDRPGNPQYCAISVDCDGSLRKCGYRKGEELSKYSVFNFIDDKKTIEILKIWSYEVEYCNGCYWVFPYMLEKVGPDVVNYQSKYWKDRKLKFENLSEKET